MAEQSAGGRITFQTRARTVDHLGRGQIADCPTAVSELWKNAYDAYADRVSLNIFDGDVVTAGIFDDGLGMTRSDFIDRWLVIGTESKIEQGGGASRPPFGKAPRPKQGEKGIGRLSAAYLAPMSLMISKKEDEPFAAVLVDWRLFENPFLSLDDIEVGIDTFDAIEDIAMVLPRLFATVASNMDFAKLGARGNRVEDAWRRFDAHERSTGLSPTTSERIRSAPSAEAISDRQLQEWPVYNGSSSHGTALLMLELHRELALHVDASAPDDDEVKQVKSDLTSTLTGFTDPFAEKREAFEYNVYAHNGTRRRPLLQVADIFSLDEFRALEHSIEGEFDEHGIFRGRLRVFNKDRGEITILPSRPLNGVGREKLGPFSFNIGTFEVEQPSSTHPEAIHGSLLDKAEKYGGVFLYRDNLRVMPYGNHDADLFGIEERRTRHAGRYFFSHRRSFGRAAFTREDNPNLKDKAGREGLVDNRAFRELQLLVVNLLKTVAQRYFGTDSDIRMTEFADIKERNRASNESARKATSSRAKQFRDFLKRETEPLENSLKTIRELQERLDGLDTADDSDELTDVGERLLQLKDGRERFRVPPLPSKLGDHEASYRRFRDNYRAYSAALDLSSARVATIMERIRKDPPEVVATRRLQVNQGQLNSKLTRYRKTIEGQISHVSGQWRDYIESDFKVYFERATPLIGDLERGVGLSTVLNALDGVQAELEENFAARYEPFIRTLEQVKDNVDLDGALAVTEDERAALDRRVNDFNVLAQMGIAVEIIGHELETMDQEVRRNLLRLPAEIQRSEAFKLAYEAHRALSDRFRFLAPLRLAGYRSRETISGKDIGDYVKEFFAKRIRDERVRFEVTTAFEGIRIVDLRSRMLPIFINLVNNALYWVRFSEDRRITLDCVDDLVIIADSGPGVDEHDIPNLFELFFTRRASGRGVGLHLCRLNLAVGHHTIRYATDSDPHILPGANFIIEFRGLTRG